jgi:hypothetical protein
MFNFQEEQGTGTWGTDLKAKWAIMEAVAAELLLDLGAGNSRAARRR